MKINSLLHPSTVCRIISLVVNPKVTRGGLLETLLEISHLSGVGIEVDASRLPIPPMVARFAQTFKFDPLRMISSGTLATTVPPDRVADVTGALTRMGVLLADVGRVAEGSVCVSCAKEKLSTTVKCGAKKMNWPTCGLSILGMNNLGIRMHSRKEMRAMLGRKLVWSVYKASI